MTLPRFLPLPEIKECVISPTVTFSSALDVLSKIGFTICLVCDDHGFLLGILTDSDVRKSLLSSPDLNKPISLIMNISPYFVNKHITAFEAQSIMEVNHYFHLPVVDSSNKLTGLYLAPQLCSPVKHPESLVIMAGGRGKRLMPLTNSCPKPMLPINGKPILHHLIDSAKSDGFSNIFVSVNYLSDHIVNYFGDGSRFGVSINYLEEDKPLGTAGCLSLLPPAVRDSPVVVMNGDVISNVSLSDILHHYYSHDAMGVMAVRSHEWQNPFGVVKTNGHLFVCLDEKPVSKYLVNAGIYVLSTQLLSLINNIEYVDMPSLFERGYSSDMKLCVFPIHESWIDIGRPDDYNLASSLLPKP